MPLKTWPARSPDAGGIHVIGGNNFKSYPYHHVTSPSFNWSQVGSHQTAIHGKRCILQP
jgi:hypothetical protein